MRLARKARANVVTLLKTADVPNSADVKPKVTARLADESIVRSSDAARTKDLK